MLKITCKFFAFTFFPYSVLKCPEITKLMESTPQIMFSSGTTLRIFFFFWLKFVLKDLWTYVQSFWKICQPVSDLWTAHKIYTIRAKVCMSKPSINLYYNLISLKDHVHCSAIENKQLKQSAIALRSMPIC